MEGHFKFGHRMDAVEIGDSSSDSNLDNLFKIGDDKINMDAKPQNYIQLSDDSDQTPKQDMPQKHRKVKKERKNKHNKERKRQKEGDKKQRAQKKKHKKQKKVNYSGSQSGNSKADQMQIYQKSKGVIIPLKYQGIIKLKSIEEELNSDFQLNLKLGEGLMNVDIISFPQKDLYSFGLMDKDIPQYNRFPNFNRIIGWKDKKQKSTIQHLNKVINQKNQNPNSDEISRHRYFNFQGYQSTGFQKPPKIRTQTPLPQFIPLNRAQIFTQSTQQQSLLKINRDFNCKLNENPNNVDLWIQFVNAQYNLATYTTNNKAANALLERQISILQKALQHNPANQQLANLYIQKLLAKHTEYSVTVQKCLEFIKAQPHSLLLWKTYLHLRISEFSTYSHDFARKVFEEVLQLLRGIIQTARSAVQLWKIRKAGLQILKNIVFIYKMQGYGQLATGIIVALIDYNFFMPQDITKLTKNEDRVKVFGEYWQNHQIYKLGDTALQSGWDKILLVQTQGKTVQQLKYIGKYQTQTMQHQNIYQTQLSTHTKIWHPSHPIVDRDIITERPQSYILIQDIDFALSWYRDSQSLMGLIDLLADHLQLPLVSAVGDINSQYSFSLVQNMLQKAVKLGKFDVLMQDNQFFWWQRYWNPAKSAAILTNQKIRKLQYFRRILESVKPTLNAHKEQVNYYLAYIYCCYYLNDSLRQQLGLNESQALALIEKLLSEPTLNIGVWCMYIQTTFLLKNNAIECINCYLQLFQSLKAIQHGNSLSKLKFQIFYWLWEFIKTHSPFLTQRALKLYLSLLDNQTLQKYSLQDELSPSDNIRLERYLKQKLILVLKQTQNVSKTIEEIVAQSHLPIIILDCLKRNYFYNLINYKDQINSYLISKIFQSPICSNSQYFILCALTARKLIPKAQIYDKLYLVNLPYLETIRYWTSIDTQPLITLIVRFQLFKDRNLPLWMAISAFLWQKYATIFNFYVYFYAVSKKLSQEENMGNALYTILLNDLLLYDTNTSHSQFLQSTLKKLPYSKQLYLLSLLSSESKSQANRIKMLIQQKSIRIVNHQLFQ